MWILLALLLMVGCSAPPQTVTTTIVLSSTSTTTSVPAAQSVPPEPPSHAVPAEDFAAAAVRLRGGLLSRIRAKDWRTGKETEDDSRASCYSIGERTTHGDSTLEQTASFFSPVAPSPLVIPDSAPNRDECELQHFQLQTSESDESALATIVTDIVAALSRNGFGEPSAPFPLPLMLSFQTQKAAWVDDKNVIVLLVSRLPSRSGGPSPVTISLVGSARGVVNIETGNYEHDEDEPWLTDARALIAETIRIAGLDPSTSRTIERYRDLLAERERHEQAWTDEEVDGFVRLIEALTRQPKEMPSERRAAALLTAELLLLHQPWNDLPPIDAAKHDRFRARVRETGTKLVHDELGDTEQYDHTWLKAARGLNASGRIRDLVFLQLMSMGFETSFGCADQKGSGYRAVLTEGGKFLAANPSSSIAADVHFQMAKADLDSWHVQFGFAHGGLGVELPLEGENPKEGERAKQDALHHYRLGLAASPDSPQARELWPMIWRARAGVRLPGFYFVCYYD